MALNDKEIIELAVAIQGNIVGVVGISGIDAIDAQTKKEILDQVVEAIVVPNAETSKDGKVPLLDNTNIETVKAFAQAINDKIIAEIKEATKGKNLEPEELAEAMQKTSITKAATPNNSPRFHLSTNAMDVVTQAIKFCDAVNQGNSKTAEVLAKKVAVSNPSLGKG